MEDEYDIVPKKKRRDSLDKLKNFESDDYLVNNNGFSAESFLPSLSLKTTSSKKKKKKDNIPSFKTNLQDPDEWYKEMIADDNIKIKRKKKKGGSIFELLDDGDGKKKKKKDKKDSQVDYKKEFAPEAALYSGLLKEQQRFTNTLQQEYDKIKSSKSTARGYSKTLTDLTANITTARSLAMQLIDKQVSIKKTAADLEMKQRKEASLSGLDDSNMAEFGSAFLRQMIEQRQNGNINDNIGNLDYQSDEDIFNAMNEAYMDDDSYEERPSEVEAYLKYENSGVNISVIIHNNDETDFDFIAKDANGNVLDDYPLPTTKYLTVNKSANVATDTYGRKYNIIWD